MTLESPGSFRSAKLPSPSSDRNTGIEGRVLWSCPAHSTCSLHPENPGPFRTRSPTCKHGEEERCTPFLHPTPRSQGEGREHTLCYQRKMPICPIFLNTGYHLHLYHHLHKLFHKNLITVSLGDFLLNHHYRTYHYSSLKLETRRVKK